MVTINSYMVILVCDFACLAQDVPYSRINYYLLPGLTRRSSGISWDLGSESAAAPSWASLPGLLATRSWRSDGAGIVFALIKPPPLRLDDRWHLSRAWGG